eukprot:SAG25_NODE_4513_length_799_cov_1.242857_2_plen_92_part_00
MHRAKMAGTPLTRLADRAPPPPPPPPLAARVRHGVIDYQLQAQHHSEQLVRLPRSFLCYTPHYPLQPVVPLPAVANGFVTFGTFNALAKLR